jgi:hypothetical protein
VRVCVLCAVKLILKLQVAFFTVWTTYSNSLVLYIISTKATPWSLMLWFHQHDSILSLYIYSYTYSLHDLQFDILYIGHFGLNVLFESIDLIAQELDQCLTVLRKEFL